MTKYVKKTEKLDTEIASLKSNCGIAQTAFSDIQEICFAGINDHMDKKSALRAIVMMCDTAIGWTHYE